MTTYAAAGLLLEPGGRPGTENLPLEQTMNHTDPTAETRVSYFIQSRPTSDAPWQPHGLRVSWASKDKALERLASRREMQPAWEHRLMTRITTVIEEPTGVVSPPTSRADKSADVLVAEARRAIHESLTLLPVWEADRVRSLIADLETAVESRTAIRLSAAAAVAPAADQTCHCGQATTLGVMQTRDGHVHIGPQLTPTPADRAAVLREAADNLLPVDVPANYTGAWALAYSNAVQHTAEKLRRLADEAQQQPECVASISGCCLRESQSETACDTEAGECVHGGRPAVEARQDEAQQCPGVETVPNRCTCDCEGCKHHCGAHQAEEEQQPDTEAPTKETGAALARYIADQPMSEIQAAIRILGWPPLRFELVDAAEPAPVAQQPADYEEHVCKPGTGLYWCPTSGQTESDCHGGFDVCCDRPDLHRPIAPVQQPAAADTDGPRTVCVCGHTRAEHIRIGGPFGRGRLLCDACNPDSTDNLTCKEFEAL